MQNAITSGHYRPHLLRVFMTKRLNIDVFPEILMRCFNAFNVFIVFNVLIFITFMSLSQCSQRLFHLTRVLHHITNTFRTLRAVPEFSPFELPESSDSIDDKIGTVQTKYVVSDN